jgi:hypothetical protein
MKNLIVRNWNRIGDFLLKWTLGEPKAGCKINPLTWKDRLYMGLRNVFFGIQIFDTKRRFSTEEKMAMFAKKSSVMLFDSVLCAFPFYLVGGSFLLVFFIALTAFVVIQTAASIIEMRKSFFHANEKIEAINNSEKVVFLNSSHLRCSRPA